MKSRRPRAIGNALRRRAALWRVGIAALFGKPSEAVRWPVDAMGVTFPNPLGLAAGFDRSGVCLAALESCGFGFVEIGSVGGPGSTDLESVVSHLRRYRTAGGQLRVGVNFRPPGGGFGGADAEACAGMMRVLWPWADYLTVNLAPIAEAKSPSIRAELEAFLNVLASVRRSCRQESGRHVPLAAKLNLDVSQTVLRLPVFRAELDGVIAVSADLSLLTEAVAELAPLPVISVGGICRPEELVERLRRGAAMVQIHDALYRLGPNVAGRLLAGLPAGRLHV